MRFWLPWTLGVLLAASLIGITVWSLRVDPPNPQVYQKGAFRCDSSWRLPCDGVR